MSEAMAVLRLLDSPDPKLAAYAGGYAEGKTRHDAEFPFTHLHELADRPLAQARLLRSASDLPRAWAQARELGAQVDRAYWDEFVIYGRGKFELVDETSRQLLDHARPAAALDLMQLYLHGERKRPDPEYVIEGLEQLGVREGDSQRLSGYEIETLIQYLRDSDVDEDRVAMLEWKFLPALGHEPSGLFLERKLGRDPRFFVEVLSLCFRAEGAESAPEVPQAVATNAYRLLDSWRTLPGSAGPGLSVDYDGLEGWFNETRPLLLEAGRTDIGEQVFGQVLAHAKADDDGLWPEEPVRRFIDRVASEQVEIGFRIECFNKRGVVSRALDEGGRQEYALADTYQDWADRMSATAPRTSRVLRSLADGYRQDGAREDEAARRRLEGFDD